MAQTVLEPTLTKDAAANILRDNGFDSENINGVVITRLISGYDSSYYKSEILKIESILKDIGYNASKGIHIVKPQNSKTEN